MTRTRCPFDGAELDQGVCPACDRVFNYLAEPEHGQPAGEPLMTVTVEVWPLAADETGIYLLSPDGPWPSPPISAHSEPHEAVESELVAHSVSLAYVPLMHSTSWRAEQTSAVLTYPAVVTCPGLVWDAWPEARPVTPELFDHVGRPPTHGPTDPPTPRYVDVLLHALRHLAYEIEPVGPRWWPFRWWPFRGRPRDATVAVALDPQWKHHLAAFSPAIARMYDRVHQPA